MPLSETSSFTSYSANEFGSTQQRQLAGVYRALDAKGCLVMLSNSDTRFVHDLYNGFRIEIVEARAINSAPNRRGPITEVVVLNYG